MNKLLSCLMLLIQSILVPHSVVAQEKVPLTEEEIVRANNPLADIKAFNLHNYYAPTIYGSSNLTANTFLMRYAMPFAGGKILMRATLPLFTVPTGPDTQGEKYSSGLGDLNLFATYTISRSTSKTLIGVGPQIAIPTATSYYTGSGKWQLGGAVIVFNASSQTLQWGALITYQTSIAGQKDRQSTSLLAIQPFGLFQLGSGTYLRSTGISSFNLQNNSYSVPFGLGLGQVLKTEIAVVNIFLEPQFTILHQGAGQQAVQVFAGLNFQF